MKTVKNMAYYKAKHGVSEQNSPFSLLDAYAKKTPVDANIEIATKSGRPFTNYADQGISSGNLGSYEFKSNISKDLLNRGNRGSENKLSLTGGLDIFRPNISQSSNFQKSKQFASTNIGKVLMTDKERESYADLASKNISERPHETKLSAGLDFSKSWNKRGSETKINLGGGGTLIHTGKHMKGKDAGVYDIHRKFDADITFNRGTDNEYTTKAFSNTYGRGDTEHFYGGTASSIGVMTGGVLGTTASGENIFTGGTGEVGQDYKDLVDRYGLSEQKTNYNIKTYKEKQKSTKIKPYLSLGASRTIKPYRGTTTWNLSAGYGTKYAPTSGLHGKVTVEGNRYSRVPGLYGGIEASKRGLGFNIGYKFGKNK